MVLTRGVGDAGGVRAAFLGAGCGGRVRHFQAVGSWEVGAGAWGVLGNAAIKLVWRLCGRFDNCSSGGRGSEFQGNVPNRQITADGASNDADMSRSWVGTTWPITEKKYAADRGVFGCRPVETVGAPYAVVSEYLQNKAGAIGRRGLSAVRGGRF